MKQKKREINQKKFEKELEEKKRAFKEQIKQHHSYCEQFVDQQKTMIEARKNLVANIEVQKHQVEEVVRDMFIKNTYDIKQFESLRDKVKTTSIFDANSTIKSQNIDKGKHDLNSTA